MSGAVYAGPAAPCGTQNNPKCGDTEKREASSSDLVRRIDFLAKQFRRRITPYDGVNRKMTILEATNASDPMRRQEVGAGIIVNENGVPRMTRTVKGGLDGVEGVGDQINKEMRDGDTLVGVIHFHPGGEGAQHFSSGDIEVARQFKDDNKKLLNPGVGVLFYLQMPMDQGGGVLVFDVSKNLVTTVKPYRFLDLLLKEKE